MNIIDQEAKKTLEVFKILELPEVETKQHIKNIKNALLMDMVAEAFAEKGQIIEDSSFSEDDMENFLTDNYEESEIEEILRRVCCDVMVEYFSKALKGAPEDKIEKVNAILAAKFE